MLRSSLWRGPCLWRGDLSGELVAASSVSDMRARTSSLQMRPLLTVPQQPLRFLAKLGPQVGARERIGHVGGEKADLGPAAEALPLELEAIERLPLGELDHRIGELDLTAGAAILRRANAEALRLRGIAAGDDEIGGRLRARRLLHHPGDAEQLALGLADADDAVHMDALGRHFLDRDHVCALA